MNYTLKGVHYLQTAGVVQSQHVVVPPRHQHLLLKPYAPNFALVGVFPLLHNFPLF